ncbi:MAG: DAK2 domain-containing protein [Oscillospiraceae bacterium]|jgi:DAK2 domain fusion protein YloV
MINGPTLRDAFISGANNLENHREEVDSLNVFPVPDGDTGTNMTMTISNAVDGLKKLGDDATVETVSKVVSTGCLKGARGNSGVILSLIFRGFSRAMQGHTEADSDSILLALQKGVGYAYKAVMKPTEGTILTVARRASEEAAAAGTDRDPAELFDIAVEAAEKALKETPEQLDTLKKAGVVDAGGQGLLYIFKGMQQVFRGGSIVAKEGEAESAKGEAEEKPDQSLKDSYVIDFDVLSGRDTSVEALKASIEAIGENTSFSEDSGTIHVHVDSQSPDTVITKALQQGRIDNLKIRNLYEELYSGSSGSADSADPPEAGNAKSNPAYADPDPDGEIMIVAVSDGKGIDQMFTDLGASGIVSGGQTMNPSTEDILSAIESVPTSRVLVLANNKNIVMAADAACGLADRKAVTVPTKSVPQGLSAMLAFDPSQSLEDNRDAMMEAAGNVVTGQVTYAVRDSEFAGKLIRRGSILCLINGKVSFSAKEVDRAVVRLAKKMCTKDTSFLTLIYGDQVKESEANAVAGELRDSLPPTIEISVAEGGQPIYYYYLSAE